MKWPDFVGALHVKQGWGEAQVSGVIHNVNVYDHGLQRRSINNVTGSAGCGLTRRWPATLSTTRSAGASTPA